MIRVGGNFDDRPALFAALDRLHAERGVAVVIASGARGAHTLAWSGAKEPSIPTKVYTAEWERLGRKAGPIRNQRMLDEGRPDLILAFPGGFNHACVMDAFQSRGLPMPPVILMSQLVPLRTYFLAHGDYTATFTTSTLRFNAELLV